MENEVTQVAADPWTVISTIAAAISALLAAVAAGISFQQARDFRASMADDQRGAKILRAFEYSPAASPMYFEKRQKLLAAFGTWHQGEPVTVEMVRTLMSTDEGELRDAFNYVLNHFGRMASAVHHDVIDERVAKELLGYSFLAFWTKFQPHLKSQFETTPILAKQYEHSADLYARWRKEGTAE